jgi:hypothetical protein
MPDIKVKTRYITDTYPSAEDWKHFEVAQARHLRDSPLPDNELIDNLTLYASLTAMRRFLFWDRMYQKILRLQGVGMVFGVRWGRDLAALQHLRTIYEPMNYTRKFIGFDTFEGFPAVHQNDGEAVAAKPGAYSVSEKFEDHLLQLLLEREAMLPYNQLQKVELEKGDAAKTLKAYLQRRPETSIAFCYFDFDLYEPTRICAELIRPYLCRGAVVAFDEYMHPTFPGETKAVREVFGPNLMMQRVPQIGPGHPSFFIFEG